LGRNTAGAFAKKVDVIVTYRSSEVEAKMLSLQLKKLAVKLLHYNWILLTPKLTICSASQAGTSGQMADRGSLISSSTMPGLVFMHRLQKRLRSSTIDQYSGKGRFLSDAKLLR